MPAAHRRIVVAINPNSAFGRWRHAGEQVVSALRSDGHDVIRVQSTSYELLRAETIAAVADATDALVVVGGDGMVNLGVNIVAETPVPLGIIGTGTGNDMARGLGLPETDVDASIATLRAALDREPRRIDAARVTRGTESSLFAAVLSAGFDAAVNERANRMRRPRGPSRYILALVRELITFRPRHYRVTIDDRVEEVTAMLVAVCNNVSLGGGMKLAPDALLDDGQLDLVLVAPLMKVAFLRLFPRVFSGTHTSLPEVRIIRVSRITLDADGVIGYADGERLGALPVEIEVVPGALLVLV